MVEHISSRDFRLGYGEYMNRARYGHEQFIIDRHAKPIAVLIGIEEYNALLRYLEPEGQEEPKVNRARNARA